MSIKRFIKSILKKVSNGLRVATHKIVSAITEAARTISYVETVSDKADTLYKNIKNSLTEMVSHSYLDSIKRISNKFDWENKDFVLAFEHGQHLRVAVVDLIRLGRLITHQE